MKLNSRKYIKIHNQEKIGKHRHYAYFLPKNNQDGVCDSWEECAKKVIGVTGARYRGFSDIKSAEYWLKQGAVYQESRQREKPNLLPGIYFDAGTGRGQGVEISVTNEKGENLLNKVMPRKKINRHEKHLILKPVTNNYGELLALSYALKLAVKTGIKRIFGDSRLIIDYWSQGKIRRAQVESATVRLAENTRKLRISFEKSGGKVEYVSGDDNPADFGFHR